jgi:Uma2 family endonuclease
MSTTTTIITPEDLLQIPDQGKGYELIDGELKELDGSARSSRVGGQIYRQLENHSQTHTPGWVFPPETGFRCFATERGQVRKPDTSFISLGRLSREEYKEDGFIEVVPDLVAEVISPNDNAEDVEIKIEDWLAAGVKVVWEVYPGTGVVRAHRPDNTITLFRGADTLIAPDVLPGFACPVADLFRLPGEPIPSA